MDNINIHFKNCYGIKYLDYNFDFSNKSQFVIYAPNGVMKSSFANTFMDLSKGQETTDRVYPSRETTRIITNKNTDELPAENIFVVEPYAESYQSKSVSTLLVNEALKIKYEEVVAEINLKKDNLIKQLSRSSGVKNETDAIFSMDINSDSTEFYKALNRLKSEVSEDEHSNLATIQYSKIFSPKILTFLEKSDFKSLIAEYMEVFVELTSSSNFFKKGVFNHNNATDIAKNLKSNGFFKASHSVYINCKDVKKEIKTEADLETVIQEEKDLILNNDQLKESFEKIDKELNKNVDMKNFRSYLSENLIILPELQNLNRLKQRLWVAYLAQSEQEYLELLANHEKGKEAIEEIINEAKSEDTRWKNVIDIFNTRFTVPFLVTMENQDDVILKSEAPNIKFRFQDMEDGEAISISEKELFRVLSNGEKRALYILNIIFEVEARRESGTETLFIIDDIADSFDYKNKYAIVEYLKDISNTENFFQIILTHNFDFFRTISSRLDLTREHKLHCEKTNDEVLIYPEMYQNNPFTTWKKEILKSDRDNYLIATIPFARELAILCGKKDDADKLTSFLHIKNDTRTLTIANLEKLLNDIITFPNGLNLANKDQLILELVYSQASNICANATDRLELETKVVLSIAIRLKAEEHMIKEINDQTFLDDIDTNQTRELTEKYKELFNTQGSKIETLNKVSLMTPENIHLNSFMYEPILDMSNQHLTRLYQDVSNL